MGKIKIFDIGAKSMARRATIEATVTRADGTVEVLGIVAQSDFTLRAKLETLFHKFKSLFSKG